jgi:hypothetical protein
MANQQIENCCECGIVPHLVDEIFCKECKDKHDEEDANEKNGFRVECDCEGDCVGLKECEEENSDDEWEETYGRYEVTYFEYSTGSTSAIRVYNTENIDRVSYEGGRVLKTKEFNKMLVGNPEKCDMFKVVDLEYELKGDEYILNPFDE